MSTDRPSDAPPARLAEACTWFLIAAPPPHPEWPIDVQLVFAEAMTRLLDPEVTARAIVERCGLRDHNVYSRFKRHVGFGIKEVILLYRLRFAKKLLRDEALTVAQIAQAVGYRSPGGFSATFRRRWGCSPTEYRKQTEG